MTEGLFKLGVVVEPRGAVLAFEKKKLRATMRRAGSEVLAVARKKLGAGGTGRLYYGIGGSAKYRGGPRRMRYQASAPDEAPASVTGTLAKSLKVYPFKSGEGVAVRAGVFYALFLENGAKGGGRMRRGGVRVRGKAGIGTARVLDARPFLTTALDERQNSIAARIRAAVVDDIAFKREKA